ncbi:uncharacterized protein BDR25DRAFT_359630 [Lindgomyces ingoldianus]|uniref:Uncharacterized protein n=1 Tax=Lindgomyces ingoldianus TaxID=673940 RepID=A0ACB6QHA6_9PLEO|nr:uncharacterized protein BDR25DRAFT_359630 [Lindgomyces ingoldianus]KAF2466262.1 hypothetical protein BDR25DRAFT_359630 [Lindgomyces ingoldianus]
MKVNMTYKRLACELPGQEAPATLLDSLNFARKMSKIAFKIPLSIDDPVYATSKFRSFILMLNDIVPPSSADTIQTYLSPNTVSLRTISGDYDALSSPCLRIGLLTRFSLKICERTKRVLAAQWMTLSLADLDMETLDRLIEVKATVEKNCLFFWSAVPVFGCSSDMPSARLRCGGEKCSSENLLRSKEERFQIPRSLLRPISEGRLHKPKPANFTQGFQRAVLRTNVPSL